LALGKSQNYSITTLPNSAISSTTLSAGPQGRAIERYFEVSLLLLVVTAFATLAGTGRLDLPSMFLVTASLVARGYLLAKGRSLVLSERATTRLTLGYVLFYLLDFFFITGNFVSATVHLVLFSMVIKIFSVQRERDHLYLAVLSFLMVLAAAVLTVDSLFLAAFCLFLVLAVTTFSSMEMRRSYHAALGEPILDPSSALGGRGISPAGSHPPSRNRAWWGARAPCRICGTTPAKRLKFPAVPRAWRGRFP